VPWNAPGSTAIVILTQEAEPLVGALYQVHANAGRDGMTPHVTLHVPFVPADRLDEDVLRRLRRLFGRFEPFDYHLRRFERFGSGVLYLAPEPPDPFVSLASALAEEFPEYPLYEGIHDVVIPHVTVADGGDEELYPRIRTDLEPRLPVNCQAAEGTLVERGEDLRWRHRDTFPLGATVS
jgi:2'-5' RNA ligase